MRKNGRRMNGEKTEEEGEGIEALIPTSKRRVEKEKG